MDVIKWSLNKSKLYRIVSKIILCSGILYLLIGLMTVVTHTDFYVLVLGIVVLVFYFCWPFINMKRMVKRHKNSLSWETIYSVYEDKIELQAKQANAYFTFEQISLGKETKDCFYMLLEGVVLVLTKSGFTLGTAEDFSKFIHSKVNFEK